MEIEAGFHDGIKNLQENYFNENANDICTISHRICQSKNQKNKSKNENKTKKLGIKKEDKEENT